jgi:hypothetical protein
MRTTFIRTLALALLSLAAGVALANDDNGGNGNRYSPPPPAWPPLPHPAPTPNPHPVSAPELDPAQGIAALTLLSGAVAILRARRSKKKQPSEAREDRLDP